ncbi:MAG: N-acetylmuramoyl-L-alanine amidase [Chloroflexi bacterium]|nr:N-acetylmuramoyl-L-alanine amidase [Chloroflexota bacterium]MCL5025668.1 N-acetylmuramoyl-L-alanine amidase [Chloroflexota bacterium]
MTPSKGGPLRLALLCLFTLVTATLTGLLALTAYDLAAGSAEGMLRNPTAQSPPGVDPDTGIDPEPRPAALQSSSSSDLSTTATRSITVAIDPGHGGPADTGGMHRNAEGEIDLTEKQVNLAIAIRLAELLRGEGYRVVLTREADKAVNDPPQDRNGDGQIDDHDELQARVDIVNASGARVFVSVHSNGFPDPAESGTEIWWSPDRSFADDNAFLAAQTQTAVLKRLADAGYRSEDRGLKVDRAYRVQDGSPYIFVLGPAIDEHHPRATQMPGILGETLFITNDTEAGLLRQPSIIDALAMGYRDGIVAFLTRR